METKITLLNGKSLATSNLCAPSGQHFAKKTEQTEATKLAYELVGVHPHMLHQRCFDCCQVISAMDGASLTSF